uniref:Uncharacterized protein n=1 Tax=uncultured marine group II/III euryarchaeote AD1000_31_H02 TaxID=1457754 RepID=A0A075FP72_9EURY|nr:hypothetical protein [uncultured marine group II/III euryarchaeote AD1000_31_H02]
MEHQLDLVSMTCSRPPRVGANGSPFKRGLCQRCQTGVESDIPAARTALSTPSLPEPAAGSSQMKAASQPYGPSEGSAGALTEPRACSTKASLPPTVHTWGTSPR